MRIVVDTNVIISGIFLEESQEKSLIVVSSKSTKWFVLKRFL